MLETLKLLDQKLFFFLNGAHHDSLDQVMALISETEVWLPLYGLLIVSSVFYLKKYSLVFIIAAVMAVGASDYTTSGIMKKSFKRFRPSRDEALMEKVHIVNNYRGGKFGFASSHAANTFAVAMFFFLFFRSRFRWVWALFLWATIVSYSRIYLGVHYPGDIIVGGLIGCFFGWLFFKVSLLFMRKKFPMVMEATTILP